ncbi:hypothetical protein ATANTOWER_024182, partial [Ataeniobius toweri]|nr:hypothetical protein [Ataeniobius toweri]
DMLELNPAANIAPAQNSVVAPEADCSDSTEKGQFIHHLLHSCRFYLSFLSSTIFEIGFYFQFLVRVSLGPPSALNNFLEFLIISLRLWCFWPGQWQTH